MTSPTAAPVPNLPASPGSLLLRSARPTLGPRSFGLGPILALAGLLLHAGPLVAGPQPTSRALAFERDPGLDKIRGYVEDSGEGRWTAQQAIDSGVPAEVITLALLARFRSRQDDSFRDRVLAALRQEFGGHAVKEK